MDKVPACWEHMSMVWSALKLAHSTRSSLPNTWLDISNAYGFISRRLLFLAMERYGVIPIEFPISKCSKMFPISVTLASLAGKFVSTDNVALPLVRAFVNDLNLMSLPVSGAQNLLDKCVKALSRAYVNFRADKPCSIVIVWGKSMNTTAFYVTEPSTPSDFTNSIPSKHSVPVKFLGRIINSCLTDQNLIDELQKSCS